MQTRITAKTNTVVPLSTYGLQMLLLQLSPYLVIKNNNDKILLYEYVDQPTCTCLAHYRFFSQKNKHALPFRKELNVAIWV